MSDAVWYVIHTKPREEARAYVNLTRQDFAAFLPMGRERKTDRPPEPLFPRYLFVEIPDKETNWAPIMSTFGVSTILSDPNGFPVPVRASVIDELRSEYDPTLDAIPITSVRRTRSFRPGGKVRIIEGPLQSLDALFVALHPNGVRADILLDITGRSARVEVDADQIIDIEPKTA